jgi:hypothetical protein
MKKIHQKTLIVGTILAFLFAENSSARYGTPLSLMPFHNRGDVLYVTVDEHTGLGIRLTHDLLLPTPSPTPLPLRREVTLGGWTYYVRWYRSVLQGGGLSGAYHTHRELLLEVVGPDKYFQGGPRPLRGSLRGTPHALISGLRINPWANIENPSYAFIQLEIGWTQVKYSLGAYAGMTEPTFEMVMNIDTYVLHPSVKIGFRGRWESEELANTLLITEWSDYFYHNEITETNVEQGVLTFENRWRPPRSPRFTFNMMTPFRYKITESNQVTPTHPDIFQIESSLLNSRTYHVQVNHSNTFGNSQGSGFEINTNQQGVENTWAMQELSGTTIGTLLNNVLGDLNVVLRYNFTGDIDYGRYTYNSEKTLTTNTRPVLLLERIDETRPEYEDTIHYDYNDGMQYYLHYDRGFFIHKSNKEIVTVAPSWVWEMRSGLQQALNQGKISPWVVYNTQPIILASSLTNSELRWIGLNTITDDEWLNQPYRPTSRLELVGSPDPNQPARWIVRANPDDDV